MSPQLTKNRLSQAKSAPSNAHSDQEPIPDGCVFSPNVHESTAAAQLAQQRPLLLEICEREGLQEPPMLMLVLV
jgi:hypothetical protein